MTSLFGASSVGFLPKQQQDVITDLRTAFQAAFGANINLAPSSVFGQLIGIVSEREALLWQVLEALYNNSNPGAAEGIAIDNLLGMTGLVRLAASPTVTQPSATVQTNGIPLYGLVLYGTPGTVIAKGSVIQTTASPPLSFTTDQAITISPAASAVQSLYLSNTPTSGLYTLTIATASAPPPLQTPPIGWQAQDTKAQLTWLSAPASGTFTITLGGLMTTALAYNASATTVQTAVRALSGFGSATVTAISGGYQIAWPAGFNPVLGITATTVIFASAPSSGAFVIQVGAAQTASLAYNATPAQVQAAIRALAGYSTVIVGAQTNGYVINWVYGVSATSNLTPPAVTVPTNTTGVPVTVPTTYGLDQPPLVCNSVQAAFNNLHDSPANNPYPYSDVSVAASGSQVFTFTFGALTPQSGSLSSGLQPQPLILIPPSLNTLANVAGGLSTPTNLVIAESTSGTLAQGTGTATCTVNGPNFAAAGALSVIGSAASGWTGVTNQLDAIPGTNTETDAAAIVRRGALMAAAANGPIQSIAEKVLAVSGVTNAIGLQNTTDAALQTLQFSSVPVSGGYQLVFGSGTTGVISGTANAFAVQSAIQSVVGLSAARVSGTAAYGLTIDFNGAFGGQAQVLTSVIGNTTGVTITPVFGRGPKSFEIVVQGGAQADIAKAIYNAAPAGIASYGAPVAQTTAAITAGNAVITVASAANITIGLGAFGLGLDIGASVTAISGLTITLSAPALSTSAATPVVFSNAVTIYDKFNNPVVINFSRPVPVLVYVNIQLLTDTYKVPGNPASGINPLSKFNPASVATIQADIVAIGNAVGIGGLIVSQGTNGLIGAFNSVAGIIAFGLAFGTTAQALPALGTTVVNGVVAGGASSGNLQMQAEQVPLAQVYNVNVSYS